MQEYSLNQNPKGTCTQRVHTMTAKYLHRDYVKAKVYTMHGCLGEHETYTFGGWDSGLCV